VPTSVMVIGELEALLVTVALPLRLPVLVGSKATLNEVDCCAASVSEVIPEVEKPEPLAVTPEMLTLALPVFVTVTVWLVLVLVFTLPKFTDVGEAESVRTGATLLPDNATTVGDVGELLVNERLA
jgi:hypothetical protein